VQGSGQIQVYDGGQADLSGCTFTDSMYVNYQAGSNGIITNAYGINGWGLAIDSSSVSVTNGLTAGQLTVSKTITLPTGMQLNSISLTAPVTISGSTISGSITVSASATISNTSFDYITINSGNLTVTGCTLKNSVPIRITDPDISLSGFSGNTYFYSTSRIIYLSGTLDVSRSLSSVEGIVKYQLSGGLTINSGAILTPASGIELITDNYNYDIHIYGQLIGQSVTIRASGSYYSDYATIYVCAGGRFSLTNSTVQGSGQIQVYDGGQADLSGCTFTDSMYVNYQAGSNGIITKCQGGWTLVINSNSTLIVVCNNFSNGQVVLSGDSSDIINLENNYWGTIYIPTIEGKITDHKDNISLPYSDYVPFLSAMCENPPPIYRGQLAGAVKDQTTGESISDVEVIIYGQTSTFTDSSGSFSFNNLQSGVLDILFDKVGYYPEEKIVYLDEISSPFMNITMIPEDTGDLPIVASVNGNFCGPDKHSYYLNGISLNETFTATIDWKNHIPYQIKWILPNQTIIDRIYGNFISRSFQMGNNFGENGKLKVIAVADNGAVESPLYILNFDVIPLPPIVNLVPAVFYQAVTVGNDFEYQVLGLQNVSLSLGGWPAGKMPSDFPLFGGQKMEIGGEFELSGTVDSDGTLDLFTIGVDVSSKKVIRKHVPTKNHKGIKLPFIELAPYGSFYASMAYSKTFSEWKPTGGFEIGCIGTGGTPQVPFPPPASFLYWRAEVSLDLALSLGIGDWDANGPLYDGSFMFEPTAKGIVGAGVAKTVCIEGYVGGGFHAELQFLPEVEWQNAYAIMLLGANINFGPFYTFNFELRRVWPEQELGIMVLNVNKLLRTKEWQLLSRDYLRYQQDTNVKTILMEDLTGGRTAEQPIKTSVFPYSTPDVARSGDNIIAVWIADDTSRSLINRTELTFAKYSNGIWSTSAAVADDGTADLNPQFVRLPNGDAVCIWQNSDVVLSDINDIEYFKSHLEIATSTYNRISGTWSAAQRLTNNSYFDRSPRIGVANSNNMIAVWISNANNDTWGSSINTNTIMWSSYNGTNWSSPTDLASGFGTILDAALAYNGTTAIYVFCTDADDNLDTSEDQELWASTYSAGSWSTPARLTNDSITDASPHLIYDSGGNLYMAWLKGNDIRFASGVNVGNSVVVVTPGESMGSKDFDLVIGDNDQIALVWNDVSKTYNDIWVSYYEPLMGTWSKARQLTSDDAAERFISGTFDVNDNLFCVYDKTWTEYEDKIVDVNGQQVIVKGVPKAGRSDLYYLNYALQADLSIAVEDVNIMPANPAPDTNATITATVRNLGESAVSDVNVAFYQGNPQSGGKLIGSIKTIPGPIAGGEDANVSVTWLVPDTNTPVDIYVVVDPNMVQEDRNWSNNTAIVKVLAPDITVSEIIVQRAGRKHLVTVRIANEGVLPAQNFEVVLRLDEPNDVNDPILGGYHIFEILPGAYHDVSFTLQSSSLPVGKVTVYVSLDENGFINEFNEDNNKRSVVIVNYAPADFEPDGDVDTDDLKVIAEQWLLTGEDLTADIYPVNKDGIVNFKDFAEFAKYWLWTPDQ
jgi:hypothetical protein